MAPEEKARDDEWKELLERAKKQRLHGGQGETEEFFDGLD
jgi:hypothetical protein